ncbi:AMP-binding protein [Piscinibacter koreensis]|uniref:AMP-binding protein n=1 Tax=Piscinibacter koreensis TaxID=2742824 RepID=A0A7Y6TXC8_9BURK|nr:AMP-binding protein [Schlegelella koreensis]NUZ07023.1 AMP-binding protein [Schlegelella koreensis]
MAIRDNRSEWDAESAGVELLDLTVGELVDRQAEALGDREAVVYRYPEIGLDLRLGFRELRERVDAVARGLIALGVGAGDKVAVLATNVPEWLLLELAVPKIGAVLVTVNTNVRSSELEYLLRQADVHTIVLMAEYRGNAYADALAALVPELAAIDEPLRQPIANDAFPQLRCAVLLGERERAGFMPFATMLEAGNAVDAGVLRERQAAVRPRDTSQIQFTSGTTGAPKGAMITHRGTINNARLFGMRAGLQPGDRMVTAMPFFHTAGNVVDVLGLLVHGATLIKAIHFDALKLLELVAAERATILHGVPTMLIAMLQHPRVAEFDASSVRIVISGGTPIPVPVLEQVKARFGADPVIGFGMTEAGPMVTGTLASDSFGLKSATVGIPLPHIALKIVDAEGRVVPLGTPGELLVRTFSVMSGYYRMPEKTAEAIDGDGWLHSGDLATIDAHGYVRIVGRIKDMIIRGGENVYPAEVENFLMRHRAIQQAQVVGVPDPYMGEEAAAFVQLRAGMQLSEDELRDHCKANMSRHKLPKYFRFVESFPLTPSGKVRKFELRDGFVAELEGASGSKVTP